MNLRQERIDFERMLEAKETHRKTKEIESAARRDPMRLIKRRRW